MSKVDLKGNPFYLNDEDIKWVEDTIKGMTIEEKIGQLFFSVSMNSKDKALKELLVKLKPGGLMFRKGAAEKVGKSARVLQENSKIPMLIAANLENGGDGILNEGTKFGHQMLVAATDNELNAYRLGLVAGREAAAVGGNMAFSPIIDINYNFRNPISNIRSFGDNPERVARMGAAYVKGSQEAGLSVTIKHFPGDGVDGRDQHLVTTQNTLSYEDWMKTYGEAYKTCINAGATGLMAGHIGLPEYMKLKRPDNKELWELPGTLNHDLLNGLLREELGYNGLIVSDATLMTGFGQQGRREDLVPKCIAAGCDMFLFTRMPEDDYNFMMNGYKNGVITEERLLEALTRIIGLKARLGLHKKTLDELAPNNFAKVDLKEHHKWAEENADQGVTLVKDEQNILPLNPNKHKKVGIIYNGNSGGMAEFLGRATGLKGTALRLFMSAGKPKEKNAAEIIMEKLKAEGFDAFEYRFDDVLMLLNDMTKKTLKEWCNKFDVIIYVTKYETMSNQTSMQLQYKAVGYDAPWFVNEVPTIHVSVGNPYHGYDFNMVKTMINGYSNSKFVYDAVVKKIVGKSEFKGLSVHFLYIFWSAVPFY